MQVNLANNQVERMKHYFLTHSRIIFFIIVHLMNANGGNFFINIALNLS